MSFRLFGLTGGIASGKSTVAARFRELGVPVVDADQIAREVVEPGTEGLRAIVERFGSGVLREDGALDRAKLGAIVFTDDAARHALNAIVHPRIAGRTAEITLSLAEKGEVLACYEAALLVENGLAETFRPLVVVSVPAALQIERAMRRDASTEDEARARISAQMPLERKLAAADIVVENDGSLEELRARAAAALEAVRAFVAKVS